jgi:hypothetical protein
MPRPSTPPPAGIAKVTTKPFTGDLPTRGGGFARQPNPFDDLFAKLAFDEEGTSGHMLTEVAYKDPAELKPYVFLLRGAAKYIGKGLDVWTVDNGIVWRARPVRVRQAAA